jgi:hypothetical protein
MDVISGPPALVEQITFRTTDAKTGNFLAVRMDGSGA